MKKRRLLSIVLTLCMVLMLVPATVFAEGGISHDGWTELTKDILESNYKDNSYYRLPSGNYYLGEDISGDKTVRIGDNVNSVDVTLDLNGYVINMIDASGTSKQSVIEVAIGGNLTLHDSRPTATHTDVSLPAGGVITRENRLVSHGGGVAVGGGSFTMNGGTIYNCSADTGGGVAVGGGSFTMNGGAIYGCNAKGFKGGGVSVGRDSSFTMNGGSIYGCSAKHGGDAVYTGIYSNLYANGGTIKGTVESGGKIQNTAADGGCTRFYDEVENYVTNLGDHGTISGGIYYGGISGGGTVEGTYHTVSFDLNGGSGSIPEQWFVNIDTAQALEPAAPTREGYEFAAWYNGDTKYDFTQNVTENITLTAHWESVEAPVITGLENGKTYCDAVEFEVTDNVGVASVTAGGVELSPTNGKYTLEKGIGNVTVVATDKSGNTADVTVTVNNGHTWSNGVCSVCGYVCNHTGGTEIRGATAPSCTAAGYTGDTYCLVCGAKILEGTIINKSSHIDKDKDHLCDVCGATVSEHSLEIIPAKEATVTETGNKEYWYCKDCKKYFFDAAGTNEIKLDDTVISKLEPEIIEGKGQSVTAGEKKALSFTSNAAYSDFIRVELDGKTLNKKNYTVKEGSTIVTLKADYVATLSAGKHTIGIVSESGTAETSFTVVEKAAPGISDDSDKDSKSDKDSVKTGDNTNLALWLALMLLSGAGITGVTVYTRRKRTNE